MATTVSAKIYSHHEKSDGTFNVKYVVYHKGERKFMDSPHLVSKRQITKDFEIRDKFVLRLLDEALDDFRIYGNTSNNLMSVFARVNLKAMLYEYSAALESE